MKRGDKLVLKDRECDTWLERSADDIKRLQDADRAAGRWHDDGGEPILYGAYSAVDLPDDGLEVTVTTLRPKGWKGWGHRPKGLFQVKDEQGRVFLAVLRDKR